MPKNERTNERVVWLRLPCIAEPGNEQTSFVAKTFVPWRCASGNQIEMIKTGWSYYPLRVCLQTVCFCYILTFWLWRKKLFRKYSVIHDLNTWTFDVTLPEVQSLRRKINVPANLTDSWLKCTIKTFVSGWYAVVQILLPPRIFLN